MAFWRWANSRSMERSPRLRAFCRRRWRQRRGFCYYRWMWTDVLDLNEFYRSTLGQMTVRLLRARLREVWPNVRGENVLGLGYATPFLRPFIEEAQRTMAFMPAPQGVIRWPREGRNLAALVDELDLPLADR